MFFSLPVPTCLEYAGSAVFSESVMLDLIYTTSGLYLLLCRAVLSRVLASCSNFVPWNSIQQMAFLRSRCLHSQLVACVLQMAKLVAFQACRPSSWGQHRRRSAS